MKTFRTSTGNAARNSIPLWLVLAMVICSVETRGQQITSISDGPAPLPASAVGWWKADGSADDSAERNHAVAQSIGYSSGLVGQAFRFIGTDSFVRVPSHEVFQKLTNVTLEAWVWNDAAKPFRRILTLTPDHVILAIDQAGKPYLNVRFGDLAATPTGQEFHDVTVSDSKTVTANTWHHLAGTYDGKSARLYVDGQLVANAEAPGKLESRGAGTEVYINFLQSGEVGGLIDEAAVYSRALTPEEIKSHVNASSAGMTKALLFSRIGAFFPGDARLQIRGQAGKAVTIQSSANLLDWETLATDPNPTGVIDWVDPSAGNFKHRFYRALVK